jgi:hypothetical protein
LLAQLRSVEPPLSESEITRERLSLEEAVRKTEQGLKADPVAFRRRAAQIILDAEEEREKTEQRFRQTLKETARANRVAEEKRKLEEHQRLRDEEQKRIAEEKLLAEQIEATRAQERAQQLRQEAETARIQKDIARRKVRAELAKVASPAPLLARDGRLDAGPNLIYDKAVATENLSTLPIRQRAVLKTILSDLPGNSPRYLRTSLESYDEELKVRGAQPILGLLKDIFEIIQAAVDDPNAQREWLEPGLQKAFKIIADNHIALIKHFPLDPEREELYARTEINENYATGYSLSEPFKEVAEATREANKAHLTTDDFLRVIDKMAEFAKVISTLPPTITSSSTRTSGTIIVDPEDRVESNIDSVSAKKRILLSGFGFFERVYNLLGSTATLTGTAEGVALLTALGSALSALSKFLS